jgi:hypothetical protein
MTEKLALFVTRQVVRRIAHRVKRGTPISRREIRALVDERIAHLRPRNRVWVTHELRQLISENLRLVMSHIALNALESRQLIAVGFGPEDAELAFRYLDAEGKSRAVAIVISQCAGDLTQKRAHRIACRVKRLSCSDFDQICVAGIGLDHKEKTFEFIPGVDC